MSKPQLYPLVFDQILKERVWGGGRISPLIPGQRGPIGESWNLVDLDQDQSLVAHGSLSGVPLGQVLATRGDEVMGPADLDGGCFPLLVKTIDAAQTLSVQVHPDATVARRLGGRSKSEAWYILDASPGAVIYCGLQPGVNRAALERAIGEGRVEECLQAHPARAGELFPIPPGTVHAIGGGIYLAEIQQPSDTTYRVYDWGRLGLDGRPRELHVDQALQCIDFDQALELPCSSTRVDMGTFQFELHALEPHSRLGLAGQGPMVLVGLSGVTELAWGDESQVLDAGETTLLPHVYRGEAVLNSREGARALLVSFPERGACSPGS